MNMNARLNEITAELEKLRKECSEESDPAKLDEMVKKADALDEERTMLNKKMSIENKAMIQSTMVEEKKDDTKKMELETRGKDLKESRTIKVSQDEILLPQHNPNTLTPLPFNVVSSLLDRVKTINLNGGETYTKSFVKGYGKAGNTEEGEAYSETEPTFGYCTINKVKLTAYTEITEELEKLPAIPYQAEILKNINISLRRKITRQIIKGSGKANTFTGIFSDNVAALEDSKPLELETINENTLDEIVFAYGGDEDVETGGATLILNKNDLRAFAKLRTAEGRKVYTIDYVAQTIDGIPYIINSACKAITDPNTKVGDYCIAYGSLDNYEVPIFSPIEVSKSTDYKFKEGIICYKSSVFIGGNVTGYNGFLRIKKKASSGKSNKSSD